MTSETKFKLECVDSIDGELEERYLKLRAEHFKQLVGPMDDMWLAFANQASHHLLLVNGELAGSCALDEERTLVGFYVRQPLQHHGPELLRLVLGQLKAKRMVVLTVDPGYLSAALDVASSVEPQALLYALELEPGAGRVESLEVAGAQDLQRVVDFQSVQLGAPIDFLTAYSGERIERGEMLLVQEGGQLLAVGELRVDALQAGIAHLGLIVEAGQRGQGLGKRLMNTLVVRARAQGLVPYCSTDMENIGAQRAIEQAGFRSSQRVLRVGFAL
jgi:GNAT superfamily N-acetyltransferase